jgi:hypothetical protein
MTPSLVLLAAVGFLVKQKKHTLGDGPVEDANEVADENTIFSSGPNPEQYG